MIRKQSTNIELISFIFDENDTKYICLKLTSSWIQAQLNAKKKRTLVHEKYEKFKTDISFKKLFRLFRLLTFIYVEFQLSNIYRQIDC
jgi:hypothetical protein